MPLIDAIKNTLDANPPGLAFCLLVDRSYLRLKSLMMAWQLNAPGINLGHDCRVIGAHHIRFGRRIRAQRGLWLQAVTNYGNQRFSPQITIADDVCFSLNVHISGIERIAIGKCVLMGSQIYISDHNHGVYKGEIQSQPTEPPAARTLGGGGPVTIGDNVWIGDNVVILGPSAIGDGAVIGANSVVRGIVEPDTIVAGSPAKPLKRFNPVTRVWERV